jgi:two-component system nitrate/nitrite response regulator NarL
MTKIIKVLVVDDHHLFREGLSSMFSKEPDFTVVGEAATMEEAVSIAKARNPDLVLMDVGLPDGDGLEAMDRILEFRPITRVVFLTVNESEEIAFAALRQGAKGYLIKDIDTQKLLVALRATERGELAISRELSSRYIEETTHWLGPRNDSRLRETILTTREMDILREAGAGFDNQVIAQRLSISPNTVKVHLNNISHKLGLNTRAELVEFARRQGFIRSMRPMPANQKKKGFRTDKP